MSEELLEWRDAWKKLIDASKEMILNPENGTKPFDDLTSLQDDKMLLFEKAIAFECLEKREKARELYEKASNEKTGLPVKHWRKRAEYFLKRNYPCVITDLNVNQDPFTVQWDLYFNIHYYSNLDNYIRYLAISSVSRIGSEPAMAIVIFRTCLEIGLWTYFEKQVTEINEDYKRKHFKKDEKPRDIDLNGLLEKMNNKPYRLFEKNEFTVYDKIRKAGNKAAHPGVIKNDEPYFYSPEQLKNIMNEFNQTMRYLNDHAEKYNLQKR